MGEPGWQPFPGAGVPVELAAELARDSMAGFRVGDAAFASPDVGWVSGWGGGESARLRVMFTQDAGATWSPQLAWGGAMQGRLVAFSEREAAFLPAVSQGKDINGYRAEPPAPGDSFVGPDTFLAGTQNGGVTWTLAPIPDRQVSGFHFLTPRRIWLKLWLSRFVPVEGGGHVLREGGARTDLLRSSDGGVTWQRLRGVDGVGVMTVRFQSETDALLVATGERNRVDLLYRTADGGLSWKRVPLDPPPGLPASAATLLDPVTRLGGGVLLVLKAEFRSGADRRPKWEGSYAYQPDGQGGWAGPFRLPLGVVRLSPPHLAVPGPDGRFWAAAGHDLFVAEDLAGPWEQRTVPLPDEQVLTRLVPVRDGVLWATTLGFPASAAVSGGQLYRSADDGETWNRVLVGTS